MAGDNIIISSLKNLRAFVGYRFVANWKRISISFDTLLLVLQ